MTAKVAGEKVEYIESTFFMVKKKKAIKTMCTKLNSCSKFNLFVGAKNN